MPKKTTYYQLNQYAPEDHFLREGFNADNATLDAALHSKAEAEDLAGLLTVGVYAGDGREERVISLGFRPRAVVTAAHTGAMYHSGSNWGGLIVDGHPMRNQSGTPVLTITEDGFAIHHANYGALNINTIEYYYVAVR